MEKSSKPLPLPSSYERRRTAGSPYQKPAVSKLIHALERDGFTLRRSTRTGARIYAHSDGRLTVVHYDPGSDTLTRKTLKSVLDAVGWNETDVRRLGLIS
jgi:predicted RNA binding protein YcfA (HicA-like mRNA interferase family)